LTRNPLFSKDLFRWGIAGRVRNDGVLGCYTDNHIILNAKKIMILQHYYNISDEQTEYQIIDRLSFRIFLGLTSGDKIPDARTIWLFKNKMIEKNG
jgi:hypothetical protein